MFFFFAINIYSTFLTVPLQECHYYLIFGQPIDKSFFCHLKKNTPFFLKLEKPSVVVSLFN